MMGRACPHHSYIGQVCIGGKGLSNEGAKHHCDVLSVKKR